MEHNPTDSSSLKQILALQLTNGTIFAYREQVGLSRVWKESSRPSLGDAIETLADSVATPDIRRGYGRAAMGRERRREGERTSRLAVARLIPALATYRLSVLPKARAELRHWEARAEAIPDLALREAALAGVRDKGSNTEAVAVFALCAPRARRRGALRAIAALQTAVDYLDGLEERAGAEPLAGAPALQEALIDALGPEGAATADRYRLHPQGEDGGYLAELVATCRRELATLPGLEAVRAVAECAARRCGEGQAHTHAAAAGEAGPLRAWAERLERPSGYEWWEAAAGASSSVALHALIAAAADPRTTAAEAERIDAAYFPPIGALTVLLDDLVDRAEDAGRGEHNYMSCYAGGEEAGERLALIAARAEAAIALLRHRGLHAAILAGVAGFYLASIDDADVYAAPIHRSLTTALGPATRLVVATRRLWGER